MNLILNSETFKGVNMKIKPDNIKVLLLIITGLMISFNINANKEIKSEKGENLKYIIGMRINPFIMYDLDGNKQEVTRIHAEAGLLINKKFYASFGYTPFVNSVYNFNEFWFLGFDKKLPMSWVIAVDYMIDNKKLILQTGPNIKLGKLGNVFIFLFSPANELNFGIKFGVFIPLNVIF